MPSMNSMTCIEDLRQVARRRIPRAFFDYLEAGSYGEETLRANRADLQRVKLRQRVLVDVSGRDTGSTMLGEKVSLPIALSTIGMGGLMHGSGEILACRAAQAAGIPYTLSTMSICSIEDVAAAVDKPFWFQLYVMKDRGFVRSLIERAIAAKCSALVVTVDLQVLGQRHNDVRNGLNVPPSLKFRNLVNMATKPRWIYGVLTGKRWTFGNIAGHVKGHGGRQVAGRMERQAVRRRPQLEGHRMDPQHLAGQADHQGHTRRRRRQARRQDRRGRDRGLQSWRPPARRRAVVDFDAARRSPTRWDRKSRSCSTAASAQARTSCGRWRSAPKAA